MDRELARVQIQGLAHMSNFFTRENKAHGNLDDQKNCPAG